jgi:hypothetical protein
MSQIPSLKTEIELLQALIKAAVPEIKQAPPQAVESMEELPFLVTYPSSGEAGILTAGFNEHMATIITEVHVSPNLLPGSITDTLDIMDKIIDTMGKQDNIKIGEGVLQLPYTYQFGRLEWGEAESAHIGCRFTFVLKLQGTAS